MAGYTPVFDSVFHGTLCGRWPTLPVWLTILPMADKHGRIDMTYQAMAALTGWPIDLLKQAIEELCQPDPESRTDAEEGRRLVLIDEHRSWGWQVVNHEKYREKARKSAYDAERTASGVDAERKRRERESREVPTRPAQSRADPLSDSDTDANADSNPRPQERARDEWGEFTEFRRAYPEGTFQDIAWQGAEREFQRLRDQGETAEALHQSADGYRVQLDAAGRIGTQYVTSPDKFLTSGKWRGPFKLPAAARDPKRETADDRLERAAQLRAARRIQADPIEGQVIHGHARIAG